MLPWRDYVEYLYGRHMHEANTVSTFLATLEKDRKGNSCMQTK